MDDFEWLAVIGMMMRLMTVTSPWAAFWSKDKGCENALGLLCASFSEFSPVSKKFSQKALWVQSSDNWVGEKLFVFDFDYSCFKIFMNKVVVQKRWKSFPNWMKVIWRVKVSCIKQIMLSPGTPYIWWLSLWHWGWTCFMYDQPL